MTLPVLLSASAVGRGFRTSRCCGGVAISLALAFLQRRCATVQAAICRASSALVRAGSAGIFGGAGVLSTETTGVVAVAT